MPHQTPTSAGHKLNAVPPRNQRRSSADRNGSDVRPRSTNPAYVRPSLHGTYLDYIDDAFTVPKLYRVAVGLDSQPTAVAIPNAAQLFGPVATDGFAFDAYGNLWVTLVMTDKLVAITPQRDVLTLLDDSSPQAVVRLDEHYESRTLTPEIMAAAAGTIAPWMASITFGGPDLRTVYLGSLRGTTLPTFRSPVAGLPLAHWNELRKQT